MVSSRLPVFTERFLELRGDLSQEQFAQKLGISRPSVGLYESGARIPDALGLRNIAEKCNVSADWLLGLSDAKSRDEGIQTVCAVTGLAEKAVDNLCRIRQKSASSGLDTLLNSPLLEALSVEIADFNTFCMRYLSGENETQTELAKKQFPEVTILSGFDLVEYQRQQTLSRFNSVLVITDTYTDVHRVEISHLPGMEVDNG